MNNGKDILVLGVGFYLIIHMILWYKGKIKLNERQKQRREDLLSEHDELLKGIFFLVIVCFVVLLLIKFLGIPH